MNKIIFCEGEQNSIDRLFINKYIGTNNNTIKPIGTKNDISGFLKGYNSAVKATNYILIRDRDFDFEPNEINKGLIQIPQKTNIFTTYRASIESYFIDATLLHKYFFWLRNTPKYQNKENIYIPTVNEIQTTIIAAAKKIQCYQAVRWALAKLKSNNKFFFESKWVKEDGKMPKQFDLEYCQIQANKLIDNFQEKTKAVNKEKLDSYIGEFMQKFTATDFYEQEKYLVWFHGKDLKAMVRDELIVNYNSLFKLSFNIDVYMEHICTVFNEQDFFSQFEDLNELKNKIQ
jgi:hypothetical protein